jgi:anti-sigma regulatory factor (Ser/Thr protein kinase)
VSVRDVTHLHEAEARFPIATDTPGVARRWLHRTGVVPHDVDDLVDLLVSELVTNSVIHSGLADPDVVLVRVASFPGGIRVEVVDDGSGMGADPPRGERSFGLRILDRAADRWGHADHPTRVWFELMTGAVHR